jgi:hypothetical protein
LASESPDVEQLLDAIAARVTAHLREISLRALHGHFAAGDEIRRLRNGTPYGRRVLARLAEKVGRDESGLQRMARVAETMRGPEREAILGLVDKRGFPLTPSVVDELERIRNTEQRMELARLALGEQLTVTQLRAHIAALKKAPRPCGQLPFQANVRSRSGYGE